MKWEMGSARVDDEIVPGAGVWMMWGVCIGEGAGAFSVDWRFSRVLGEAGSQWEVILCHVYLWRGNLFPGRGNCAEREEDPENAEACLPLLRDKH